jgi:RNA polymerase sigma factor (TIGR02999 family)
MVIEIAEGLESPCGYTESMASELPSAGITELLRHWEAGDREALSRLMETVYPELRKIASARLRGQGAGATISATELLHEAWIRMAAAERLTFAQRGPFFAAAATIMRNILVDRARARQAAKRDPANALPVQMPSSLEFDLPSLDEALQELEKLSPRQARQVDLRFFGGFSAEETAEILEISAATLKRDWLAARMFIKQFLEARA